MKFKLNKMKVTEHIAEAKGKLYSRLKLFHLKREKYSGIR
jgi:hypothetical protein